MLAKSEPWSPPYYRLVQAVTIWSIIIRATHAAWEGFVVIARCRLRSIALRVTSGAFVLLLGLSLRAVSAQAEKRVALVIGNSAYVHVARLPNPATDADAISLLFKSSGFDVVETHHDLGIDDMRRVVRDFTDKMQDADIAVVYYAGHGIEVDGSNYLVPVDAQLRRDIDVEDETVSLERVLKVIEPAKRLRLIILDACRENPFAKSMKRTIARRAIGRGLASVEPSLSDTLIAFAAKAGSTADDGTGFHSPFTTALLKDLPTPGLDLRIAFGRVRDDVMKATGNRQQPFVYGSLGGTNVALVSSPDAGGVIDAVPPIDPATVQAWRDYDEAAKVGTKEAWDAFLAAHPTGFYAELARAQRAKFRDSGDMKPKPNAEPDGEKNTKKTTKITALPQPGDVGEKPKATDRSLVACCVAYCRLIKCNSPSLPRACSAEIFAMYKGMSVDAQKKNYLAGAKAVFGRAVSIPACM